MNNVKTGWIEMSKMSKGESIDEWIGRQPAGHAENLAKLR